MTNCCVLPRSPLSSSLEGKILMSNVACDHDVPGMRAINTKDRHNKVMTFRIYRSKKKSRGFHPLISFVPVGIPCIFRYSLVCCGVCMSRRVAAGLNVPGNRKRIVDTQGLGSAPVTAGAHVGGEGRKRKLCTGG